MASPRFNLRAAVYLLLVHEKRVLLARRFGTGWQDGKYSMVAGHLDGNETVTAAAIREAHEEAGLEIAHADLAVVHTMHRKSQSGLEYIDFFAKPSKWIGEPKIMEKDKCDDLQWFGMDNMPSNTLIHVRQAVLSFQNNVTYSECGWDGDAE